MSIIGNKSQGRSQEPIERNFYKGDYQLNFQLYGMAIYLSMNLKLSQFQEN